MGFDCAARTHVGHKRKINEDAVLACPDRHMWAVADGMGGHQAGDVASALVVDMLANISDPSSFENHLGKAIGAIENANAALVSLARGNGQDRTIGSTVVGLVAEEDRFSCFWVGDSRAYRVRDGAVDQLTKDHSLVQELVDAGMLDPAEAESHPNANVVTRAVGAVETVRVDTKDGDLRPGDVLLLSSDGLTRLVQPSEIGAALVMSSPELAADRLLDLALERGAPDNVSFVIVRVT